MEEGADAIVEYFPQESKVSMGIDIGTVFLVACCRMQCASIGTVCVVGTYIGT